MEAVQTREVAGSSANPPIVSPPDSCFVPAGHSASFELIQALHDNDASRQSIGTGRLEPLQGVGSALPSNSGVNDAAEAAGQSSSMDVSGPEDPNHPKFADPRNFEAWLAADDQRQAGARQAKQSDGVLRMRDTGPPGSAALKAEEDDNDVRAIRAKVRPKQPTHQEVEEHEASGHLP